MRSPRIVAVLALALGVAAALAGCGGSRAPSDEEAAPFKAAVEEFLRSSSMDMRPERFESLTIDGSRATAQVRMAPKGDLYGVRPRWAFTFQKRQDGKWKVIEKRAQ